MEKQTKVVRYFILGFGLIFFFVGAGIGFSFYKSDGVNSNFSANYVLPLVFMGIGFLDIIIVSIWSFIIKKNAKKEKWLFENGQCVHAKFDSIEINYHIRVNGNFPFIIVCHWKDNLTSELRVFKSKHIWFDPNPYIDRSKNIDVYMDPVNAENYTIDLSFLSTVR